MAVKGIVLAGGRGTRLHPITAAVSKQLLPVSDKPMIYYPISVLMLAGIRDILLISSPDQVPNYVRLLGDGARFGLNISYASQESPDGIAQAFLIGASHIGGGPAALILGDNIFHGPSFSKVLEENVQEVEGCVLFGYPVSDPGRYGVGMTDESGRLISIAEKPAKPRSNRAITGLYFYDNEVIDIAENLKPSERGELEITDVNLAYVRQGRAKLVDLGRGFAWLDTGTPETLLQAGQYVQTLEQRQGVRIACLEEVALRMDFIDAEQCYRLGAEQSQSGYGQYVMSIASSYAQ
jgi:glucose-1-phosphate thymidylyltransferase